MTKNMKLVDILNKDKEIAQTGNQREKVEAISTGILPLDHAIGIGGIPRGKVIDLFGMQSVGKSSVCFTIIANAQKQGYQCAFIDAEYSYQADYAEDFGVDTENLIVISPEYFEEAAEATETLTENGVDLIIIDSVSSMVPRSEAEAEHGKAQVGKQANLMSQMMRKMVAPLARNKTTLICINQMRENIMAFNPYDKHTTTGGMALKFYSALRIEMKRKKAVMQSSEVVGYNVAFRIKKNKVARPGGECEVKYLFDEGFEKEGDVVEIGLEHGVLTQPGKKIFHGETEIGAGRAKANAYLNENPELKQQVIAEIQSRVQ